MNREYFQDGDAIDKAYESITGDSVKKDKKVVPKSTMLNLWEYIGLGKTDKKQQSCMFDCSIEGSDCLQKCATTGDASCNYGCTTNGIKCVKKCMIPDIKKMTTQVTKKKPLSKIKNKCNIKSQCENDSYAPYNSDLWPQFQTQSSFRNMGWNTSKIDEYNDSIGDEEIEVRVNNYYPFTIKLKKETVIEKEILDNIKWNPHFLKKNELSIYLNDNNINLEPEDFYRNKDFMLKAVDQNWQTLQYAHKDLKKDSDIVYTAIKQNWVALQYADEKFQPELEWL